MNGLRLGLLDKLSIFCSLFLDFLDFFELALINILDSLGNKLASRVSPKRVVALFNIQILTIRRCYLH